MVNPLSISLTQTGQLVYYGGQFIEGVVHVDVSSELKARSEGSTEMIISPGQYQYPFRFQIPPGAPTSFESRRGHVRYALKANIDKPWAFDDSYELYFTVLRHHDLNADPNAKNGDTIENSKTMCCLCCKTGPITGRISLDKIGYVPGEAIQINAEANNGSNRTMNSTSARIVMSVSYITHRKTRTFNTGIAELKKGKLEPGDSEVWYGEKLVVPPVPASGLPGCNIIDIKYYVIFTVDPAGPAFDLDVPVEITIGTIPLQQVVTQYGFPQGQQLSAPLTPMPSAPESVYDDSSLYPPPSAEMPSLPPPSYSQSLFGSVRVGDQSNEANDGQQGQNLLPCIRIITGTKQIQTSK